MSTKWAQYVLTYIENAKNNPEAYKWRKGTIFKFLMFLNKTLRNLHGYKQ